MYDLFAVSNHYGGLGGGHYTAYCRAGNDGSWHCFDDCHVTPVDEAAVQSQSAYVLFFRRRHEALRDPGESISVISLITCDTLLGSGRWMCAASSAAMPVFMDPSHRKTSASFRLIV